MSEPTPVSNLEVIGNIILSRHAEVALAPQTTNLVLEEMDAGSLFALKSPRTTNAETIHGLEGPSRINKPAQNTAEGTLKQSTAFPNTLIHQLAFYYGVCTSVSVGATSFRHDITPLKSPIHPTFTALQRTGDTFLWERFANCMVDELTLSLADGYATFDSTIKASGQVDREYMREIVSDQEDATTLTLATKAVKGSTAAERLANVEGVRVRKFGETAWTEVAVTVVSADAPAVLTITPAGVATDLVDFEIHYRQSDATWAVSPSAVIEAPLRMVEAQVVFDGTWDNTLKTIDGGRPLDADMGDTMSIKFANSAVLKHVADKTGENWAKDIRRGGRRITIDISKQFGDLIYNQQAFENTDDFSFFFCLQGEVIDAGDTEQYGIVVMFPKCGFVDAAQPAREEGRTGDTYTIEVLEDDTYGMGIVAGYNQVEDYIQAAA